MNILEQYKNYLSKEQQYSPRTTSNYLRWVGDFCGVMNKCEDVTAIQESDLEQYREKLLERDISQKTRNLYLTGLRNFLTFLNEKGHTNITHTKVKLLRNGNGHAPLELPDEKKITSFLQDTKNTLSDVVVRLLFATGLRLSELISLKVGDVEESFSVTGKGGKQRVVFCEPSVVKKVKEYAKEKGLKEGDRLFPFTPRYIQSLFEWRSDYLGVKVTPHTLRHCFASRLLARGADVRVVQELLGHASIATTQRYTHVSNKQLQDVYKKLW